jgi:hypothetical protein
MQETSSPPIARFSCLVTFVVSNGHTSSAEGLLFWAPAMHKFYSRLWAQ